MLPFNMVPGGGASVDIGDNIPYSCMVDSGASQYLSRSTWGAATGAQKTWVGSVWIKRGKLDSFQPLFYANSGAGTGLIFQDATYGATHQNGLIAYMNGSVVLETSWVGRTPDGYIHVVWAVDTTQAVAADRYRIYINGV